MIKNKLIHFYFPLLWCLVTIVGMLIWLFVDPYVLDFNLTYLFGFNTIINSLWMFISSALFGDGILTYLYIPYLIILILFLLAVVGTILLVLIKKNNSLFKVLLVADCIISILTIVIVCVYNAEQAFVWDKVAGALLNFAFLIILRKTGDNSESSTKTTE